MRRPTAFILLALLLPGAHGQTVRTGTGFAVSAQTLIVTNAHRIHDGLEPELGAAHLRREVGEPGLDARERYVATDGLGLDAGAVSDPAAGGFRHRPGAFQREKRAGNYR